MSIKFWGPLAMLFSGGLSLVAQKFYYFGIGWNSTKEEQFAWMISNPGPIASLAFFIIGGGLFYFVSLKD